MGVRSSLLAKRRAKQRTCFQAGSMSWKMPVISVSIAIRYHIISHDRCLKHGCNLRLSCPPTNLFSCHIHDLLQENSPKGLNGMMLKCIVSGFSRGMILDHTEVSKPSQGIVSKIHVVSTRCAIGAFFFEMTHKNITVLKLATGLAITF